MECLGHTGDQNVYSVHAMDLHVQAWQSTTLLCGGDSVNCCIPVPVGTAYLHGGSCIAGIVTTRGQLMDSKLLC